MAELGHILHLKSVLVYELPMLSERKACRCESFGDCVYSVLWFLWLWVTEFGIKWSPVRESMFAAALNGALVHVRLCVFGIWAP